MAHPDIMVDQVAIAEPQCVAEQPRRRQMVEVVIAGRDAKPCSGTIDVADRQHRARAVAGDLAQLRPSFRRRGERRRGPVVTGRDQRHEHPVDVARPDRVVRLPAAGHRAEIEADRRILGRAVRIVPQPHIPAPRRALRVAPLDRSASARAPRRAASAPPSASGTAGGSAGNPAPSRSAAKDGPTGPPPPRSARPDRPCGRRAPRPGARPPRSSPPRPSSAAENRRSSSAHRSA